MDHTELRRKLSDYLDNVVSGTERREIETHLQGCSRCREALAELEQVVGAIRDIPPEEPPHWLTTRIMARIQEEGAPRPGLLRRLFFPLHIKIPLEAAVLVCLCVTGYYLATMTAPELAQEPSRSRLAEGTHRLPEREVPQAEQEVVPQGDRPLSRPPLAPSFETHPSRSGEVVTPVPSLREEPKIAPRQLPPQPPEAPAATAPSDTIKAEKALPVPSQVLQGAPASPAARKGQRAVTAESVQGARDAAFPAPAPVRIAIRVDDPVRAEREIEEAVSRVGGAVVRTEPTPAGRTVTVRVATDRLPDLWARLERLGRVTERPVHPTGAPGEITVTIRLDAPF
jgi:hypothetical protein